MTVATDEIYEKYLQKAITEINALGDEVAQAGAGTRVPVVGSGHPLADVFLLKYPPRAVGAAGGRRVLRPRRQRAPQVAAAAARRPDGDLRDELPQVRRRRRGRVAPLPLRELHIVQPKLVVVMGEPARAFLNSVEFPLARELEPTRGRAAEAHADDPGTRTRPTSTSRSTSSRRRRRSGTPSRCSASGGPSSSVLEPRRGSRRSSRSHRSSSTWFVVAPHLARTLGLRARIVASSSRRRDAGDAAARATSRCRSGATGAWLWLAAVVLALRRVRLQRSAVGARRRTSQSSGRRSSPAGRSSRSSRSCRGSCSSRSIIPFVDIVSVCARARRTRSSRTTSTVYTTSRSRSSCRAAAPR